MRGLVAALAMLISLFAVATHAGGREVKIAAGPPGGVEYGTATALAELVTNATKLGKAVLVTTHTAVAGLRLVIEGSAELTVVRGDLAYEAWTGKLGMEKAAPLYTVIPLNKMAMHILAKKSVKSLGDLAAKRIAVGLQGSMSGRIASAVLDSARLSDLVQKVPLGLEATMVAYQTGKVEAAFILAPLGDRILTEGLKAGDTHLVEIPKDVGEAVIKVAPFFDGYVIPEEVYGGLRVSTLAVTNVVVSRIDFPHEAAYQITAAYVSNLRSGSQYDFSKRFDSYKFVNLRTDVGPLVGWTQWGYVDVKSEPTGAAILADGRYGNRRTNDIIHLTVGEHTVSLLKDDYERYDVKVRVQDRETARVQTRLTKKPSKRHELPSAVPSEPIRSAGVSIPWHPGSAQYARQTGFLK